MTSIPLAGILGFSICLAGFILYFVCVWRRMRVAWRKPRAAKPHPIESAGELLGFAIGSLGLAILNGNGIVDEVQRGAAPRMIVFLLVTCAMVVFVSGASLGQLLERLAARRQRRLGDGAAPQGEALES